MNYDNLNAPLLKMINFKVSDAFFCSDIKFDLLGVDAKTILVVDYNFSEKSNCFRIQKKK